MTSELFRVMPPPRSELPTQLPPEQFRFLSIIAQPFLFGGKAAPWGYVLDHCEGEDLDAQLMLNSLPRVGSFGTSYGFTSPPERTMNEGDEIRLTVAASLVLPEVRAMVGESFLMVVQHMVQLHMNRPISRIAGESVPAVLRSGELAQAMPRMRPEFIAMLPGIFAYEPYIQHEGRGDLAEGGWEWRIRRTIRDFKGVATLEQYVEKTCQLIPVNTEGSVAVPSALGLLGRAQVPAPASPPASESATESYVDEALLKELEEAGAETKWSLDKLLDLAAELNSNFRAKHFYTCLGLVRAICDHIPPPFGSRTWPALLSSYKWSRPQDKGYAERLDWFRDPANDVMHRPMGETASRITLDDVPPRHNLNGVLQELLVVLKAQAGAAKSGGEK